MIKRIQRIVYPFQYKGVKWTYFQEGYLLTTRRLIVCATTIACLGKKLETRLDSYFDGICCQINSHRIFTIWHTDDWERWGLETDYVNTVLFNGQTMTVKVRDDEGQIYKGNKETAFVEQ